MGRLADKASIVKSVFSDLEKAVIKATRHNFKGPKEKHVRRKYKKQSTNSGFLIFTLGLVVSTFEQPGKNQELIELLKKRLALEDWIVRKFQNQISNFLKVVMKTLEVFHRLLRDGNAQFINDLKYKSSIFNLRSFEDKTSAEIQEGMHLGEPCPFNYACGLIFV